MKISYRQPKATADVSAAQGTAFSELWKLLLSAVVLLLLLYLLWGVAVDLVVTRISVKTEASLFSRFQPESDDIKDKEVLERFKKAETILEKLKSGPQVPTLPYKLILMEQASPNAFAIPGGCIGVTSGLLAVLSDEIEIAFVVGHELGHFKGRDHLQGLGRAVGYSIMMAVLLDNGAGAESFTNMINFVLERSYSQKREKQADRFGLEAVYTAYGRVDGTDRLFTLLLDKTDLPAWAYMFATHPSPRERIAALQVYRYELMGKQPT